MKFSPIFLMVSLLLAPFFVFAQASIVPSGELKAINSSIDGLQSRMKVLEINLAKVEDSSYSALLEKNIAILESTNNALDQRWTPVNVMFSSIAAIFAIITIAWGVIFALGWDAYRRIQKHKKEMALELKNLRKNSSEVMNSITKDGKDLIGGLRGKTETQIEREVEAFKEKAKREIERLQDQALGTATNLSGTTTILSGWGGSGFVSTINNDLNRAKVCSRCGNFFTTPYKAPNVYEMIKMPSQVSASVVGISIEDALCKWCRDEASSN